MVKFAFTLHATQQHARTGIITTAHGEIHLMLRPSAEVIAVLSRVMEKAY